VILTISKPFVMLTEFHQTKHNMSLLQNVIELVGDRVFSRSDDTESDISKVILALPQYGRILHQNIQLFILMVAFVLKSADFAS
jgi:hypothetical protein